MSGYQSYFSYSIWRCDGNVSAGLECNIFDKLYIYCILDSFSTFKIRYAFYTMQEYILAILTFISSILLVCLFVVICWYIVWKCCLSKFRFVRELLGGMSENSPANQGKPSRVKKSRRE